MKRLFISLILLSLSSLAQAGELKINRRFEHNWKTPNWLTFHHLTRSKRSHIIALNQKNLELEILDASTGQTLLQDRLDTQAQLPQALTAYSARSGEFFVALARQDSVVEIHSIDDPVSFEVPAQETPKQLAVVEQEAGDIYLAITSAHQLAIYRRENSQMALVQKLNWKSGIDKTQLFSSRPGTLQIELYDNNGKLQWVELDLESRKLRSRWQLVQPTQQVDGLAAGGDDYFVALMTNESAQLHALSTRGEIAHVPIRGELGKSGWLKGSGFRPSFLALQKEGEIPVLSIYDAFAPKSPLRLSPGTAEQISHAGGFSVHGQTYYHYVKDGKTLHIQNSKELAAITTRRDEHIADVEIVRDAQNKTSKLLVVRLDSDSGSRLQVLELR